MAGGVTTDVIPGATVTPAVARSQIDQARARNYPHGVLGLRALPALDAALHRSQRSRLAGSAMTGVMTAALLSLIVFPPQEFFCVNRVHESSLDSVLVHSRAAPSR